MKQTNTQLHTTQTKKIQKESINQTVAVIETKNQTTNKT